MPPTEQAAQSRIHDINGRYPPEAYFFVQAGVTYASDMIHGRPRKKRPNHLDLSRRHITGQQLCLHLRELALMHWGMLARCVLEKWNIYGTEDFGRIVYDLIEAGVLARNDGDTLDDFRGVFDFRSAFESAPQVELSA